MENVQPKKNEDQSEDEKCTSRPNGIESEGVKYNSNKKIDLQKKCFPHTDDLFTIDKNSNSGKLITEIKEFEELKDKDFVGKPSGEEFTAPLTFAVESVDTDCRLGNISAISKSNPQTFYPDTERKRTEICPPIHTSYDMQTFPRGRLIIINVKKIEKSFEMSNYTCNEADTNANRLQKLFLDLGFIVERVDNPKTCEIEEVMHAASNQDYSNLGCFVCAFFSHGKEGVIYGTDGFVNINDLTSLFRTKNLAGKPKLFFIQACQKSKDMKSCDSVDGPEDAPLDLPVESDFLFCYSSVNEVYPRNHSESGSLFMEILIEVFRLHAHEMDIMRMLTLVNSRIAQPKSQTDTVATNEKHQIVSIISQLRQELYFFPPFEPL